MEQSLPWLLGFGALLALLVLGAIALLFWRSYRQSTGVLLSDRAREALEETTEQAEKDVARAMEDGTEAWGEAQKKVMDEVRDEAKHRTIADVFDMLRRKR